mmetsp:Transcript_20465/g.34509  ORF Transcript_20465/g.34509 Transcript_20465/m.34509 type:complete len:272 (+) Transcript_20465:345-1160(+)
MWCFFFFFFFFKGRVIPDGHYIKGYFIVKVVLYLVYSSSTVLPTSHVCFFLLRFPFSFSSAVLLLLLFLFKVDFVLLALCHFLGVRSLCCVSLFSYFIFHGFLQVSIGDASSFGASTGLSGTAFPAFSFPAFLAFACAPVVTFPTFVLFDHIPILVYHVSVVPAVSCQNPVARTFLLLSHAPRYYSFCLPRPFCGRCQPQVFRLLLCSFRNPLGSPRQRRRNARFQCRRSFLSRLPQLAQFSCKRLSRQRGHRLLLLRCATQNLQDGLGSF